MADPQTFPSISGLLKRQGIWLSRKKSQHFLQSQEVCCRIAELAGLGPEDLVVEVGAGLGNLSAELAARAGRVIAVEMDRVFEEWHGFLRASYPGLEFLYADVMAVDLEALAARRLPDGRLIGAGNLPYQITSNILFRFVDSPQSFDRLVFMVQKEVAERIAAGPGSRLSGALTYKIALRYRAEVAFFVPPKAFLPPPKVDSAVIVLEPLAQPHVESDEQRKRLYELLDGLFRFRRKMLTNGLMQAGFATARERAEEALGGAGIDPRRRPETLSLEELLLLDKSLREGDG